MNFEKAKQRFEKYLEDFDRSADKIALKIVHTYGVVSCSEEIAKRMNLSEEDLELAKMIALLHDIGRFEQLRLYNSFDPDTMDHAAYGVKLLFEDGMISEFVEERTYDEIIKNAIAKHSDFKLEGIEDERTLLHAKLIRDADKLDNCRVKLEDSIETILDVSKEEVGSQDISDKIYHDCMNGKSVFSPDRKTKVDYWVAFVAYFNDIYFKESLQIVKEHNYISRIIHRIPYSNPDTARKMAEIEKKMNQLLDDGE